MLGSTGSARNLSQLAQEPETPAVSLYDLVTMVHSNLEVLMRRSQNNARDLGKLRGDVKNPHAIEEIKKILQESSAAHLNGDVHDPETKRLMDTEMAAKLDALLKMSALPAERPSTTTSISSAETMAAAAQTARETNDRIMGILTSIERTVQRHLPVVIPDPLPIVPVEPERTPEPVKVMIDTSSLEATVFGLSGQINEKLAQLQSLDAALQSRRAELATLETRSAALQQNLSGLVSIITETRQAERLRTQEIEAQRATRREATLKKKKSNIGRRTLVPLAPSADRRIVSLSNVNSTPSRRTMQHTTPNSPAILAPPIKQESPFSKSSFTLPSSVNPAESEVRSSPHRMHSTLRSAPPRKASWSRRVSQIFSSTTGNKENGPIAYVQDDRSSARAPPRTAGLYEKSSRGGGLLPPDGAARSGVRSFSYRG